MSPTSPAAIGTLLPLLSRDVIDAIANRPGETEARRQDRAQGALCLIEAFEPRDGVEVMLVGQAVMFQSLMMDTIRDSHRARTGQEASRHRQAAVAMSRVQLSWFKELRLHDARRYPAAAKAAKHAAVLSAQTPEPAPATPPAAPAPARAPVPAEPARTGSVRAEPTRTEPARTEPVRTGPVPAKPVQAVPLALPLAFAPPVPPHAHGEKPRPAHAPAPLTAPLPGLPRPALAKA